MTRGHCPDLCTCSDCGFERLFTRCLRLTPGNGGLRGRFVAILRICTLQDEPFNRIKFLRGEISGGSTLPPLHRAAMCNNGVCLVFLVQLYRELGASINHVYSGYTALDLAVRRNHVACVSYLLWQHDTRLTVPPHQLITTLFNAIFRANLSTIELLLRDKRVSVTVRNNKGFDALLYASAEGRTDFVQYLLNLPASSGVDPFASNKGMTSSHYACNNGYMPMIELLLEYDCFDALRSDKVTSPQHYQHVSFVTFNDENEVVFISPLIMALMQGQRNVLKKLLPLVSSEDIISSSNVLSHFMKPTPWCNV